MGNNAILSVPEHRELYRVKSNNNSVLIKKWHTHKSSHFICSSSKTLRKLDKLKIKTIQIIPQFPLKKKLLTNASITIDTLFILSSEKSIPTRSVKGVWVTNLNKK